jgi:hypothetical protein
MDHLVKLPDPASELVEVPYLCRPDFLPDEETFDGYPEKRGLPQGTGFDEALLGLPPPKLLQFAQEWLYFTLLKEVFREVGNSIDHQEFIARSRKREPTVNSTCLTKYIAAWRRKEAHTSSDKKTAAKRVRMKFAQVARQLEKLSHTELAVSPVGLSIIILLETLSTACSVIYEVEHDDVFWVDVRHALPKLRMREQGWCPNKLKMLEHALNTSCLYIASNLKDTDRSGRSHEICTDYDCRTNNIDRDTYEPKHVTPGCACPEVGPRPESLASAFGNGGYPVIQVLESGEWPSHLNISVTQYSSGGGRLPYVAFSHVWSDGIGNLQANALPTCQLRRLTGIAAGLYPDSKETPFLWLDTLRVPYRNDEANRRRMAIGRMHETYRNADKVLVLSSDLYYTSSDVPAEEALLRIQSTSWMRRLWTLQEGILNTALYFRFADHSVALKDLVAKVKSNEDAACSPVSAIAALFSYDFESAQGIRQVESLYNSLQWRNTSWQSDEAICLSILLNVDTERIAAENDGDRMATLLCILKMIPPRLMFAPGDRLTRKGYGWAPCTMMNHVGWTIPYFNSPPAMQGPSGLLVTWPGFYFEPRPVSNRDICFFKGDGDDSLYRVMNMGKEDGGKTWAEKGPYNIDNPAIIVGSELGNNASDESGTLVSIEAEKHNVYFARYVSRVQVYREDVALLGDVFERMWAAEEQRTDMTAVLGAAEMLPATQRWYVY